MIEWILITQVLTASPDWEVWGGYHDHAQCLTAQDRLHVRYQQKKPPLQIRTRCQPVMAVQLEPRK